MKVDFIVCGTQKGGTKALDSYLRSHTEICLPEKKELHFFDNEAAFQTRNPDYSAYHAHFAPTPAHRVLGEGTPIYMYWDPAPKRMWKYNPSLKLIILLRNPIERAYSHWNMFRDKGMETLSFWDAIQSERQRCREALPQQHKVVSYVDRGFYLQQLRRLWMFFPKPQVLILKSEELKDQPVTALQKISDFLKVSPFENVTPQIVHSIPYTSEMSEAERQYLHSVYEFEIRGLERELGWDCSSWLEQ